MPSEGKDGNRDVPETGVANVEKTLDDADTIVIFSDGCSKGKQHPLVAGNHMKALEKQMKRGCGLVVIHWALNLPSQIGNETFLHWIGGFKDCENPPRPIGELFRPADWAKQATHPICRGLTPFEMPEDEYKTPERLLSDKPGFVPILPFPGKLGAPLWAWAWERENGGRGFAFIGGHKHAIWEIEDLRKAMLNAILWTAKHPVPTDGVISSLPVVPTTPPEPVFVPIKIDGPVPDPAIGGYWYGPFNESCSLVDVNGDGWLDITCGVNWYENPGPRGGKWKVHRIHASPYVEGVLPADINGDGHPDLVVNHFRRYGGAESEGSVGRVEPIVWFEAIGQEPWFVKHVIAAESDDHGIGVGDINGDGRLDVVTKHGWYEAPAEPAQELWRFHNDFEMLFRASLPILLTDVNGDGLNDLIAGNGHGYGLYWFEQQLREGKRIFVRHAIEEHYGQFHTMTLADVNGDGKPDLVTGKRLFGHDGRDEGEWDPLFLFWYDVQRGKFVRHVISFNNLQFYPGHENVNEPLQFAPSTGMKFVVGDIIGDGKPDIIVAGRGGLYAFVNRGLTPRPKSTNPKVPLIGEKSSTP